MAWYPDWHSLDSVSRAHSVFEVSGIVFLALLVVAEALSFAYGHRESALGLIRQERSEKTLTEIERLRVPRHLTEEQKTNLSAYLQGKPTGRLIVKANMNVPDSRAYGQEIAALFQAAGWSIKVDNAILFTDKPNGIWLSCLAQAKIPDILYIAHLAINAAGIPIRKEVNAEIGPEADEVWLNIGMKE